MKSIDIPLAAFAYNTAKLIDPARAVEISPMLRKLQGDAFLAGANFMLGVVINHAGTSREKMVELLEDELHAIFEGVS